MDIRKVKKLIELLEASDVAEIEIKEGDEAVRSSRAAFSNSPGIQSAIAPVQQDVKLDEPRTSEPSQKQTAGHPIKSPMVGTFYRAPAPGEPVFVEVGSKISVGQTVCILEAMKLMNEIEAETSGEIIEILVENGTPVEFGQVLMRVKPV